MIAIKTIRTEYLFRFYGNITIDIDDYPFLTVTATGGDNIPEDGLLVSYYKTIDKFWFEDIQYIKGIVDASRG